ncbi:MAG TPA: winged helix-turn-helix domain-containing protein, partial [Polyangiaceae bacterium]
MRTSTGPAEVAFKLGLHKSAGTIRFRIKHLGLDTRHFTGRNVERQKPEAILARKLLAEGCSQSEVCKKTGLKSSTVNYHAKRLGLTADQPRLVHDWVKISEYYNSGHTLQECLSEFRC